MIADQCCAEYRIRTAGRGRTVDEWRLPPNKPDNHFLDCLAGSCVAASVLGVKLSGLRMTPTKRDSDDVEDPKKYKRKRVTYLE